MVGTPVYSDGVLIGIVMSDKNTANDKVSITLNDISNSKVKMFTKKQTVSNVFWRAPEKVTTLYFKDLEVGDFFKIDSPSALGAVYRKVLRDKDKYSNVLSDPQYFQEEVATAKLFNPTPSPVKRVEASIHINEDKPSIY